MRELSACSRSRNSTPLNQHSSWKMSIARLRMRGQNCPPRVLNLQQNRVNYIVSPQKEKSDRWFPIELIDEASSIISVSKMSKRIESLGANWIAADALEPHHNPKHPPVTMCVCVLIDQIVDWLAAFYSQLYWEVHHLCDRHTMRRAQV